jgi:hypothetical protein
VQLTAKPAPEVAAQADYGPLLDIRLTSKTSLTALGEKLDAVYADADFCPLHNAHGLIAFGPFGDDGQDLRLPSAAPAQKPDTRGLYHYRIYVVVAYRARRVAERGQMQLPTYDLRATDRDLCFRLFAPGYNIMKSRSDTIPVPRSLLSEALAKGDSP